ncbi:MAG: hypothetical protein ABII12_03230 [Planctomycetota bacterium]
MKTRTYLQHLCTCFAIVTFICLAGCGQQTAAPVDQDTGQKTVVPTKTDQDQATQGSQVYLWIVNAPGRGALPSPGMLNVKADDGVSQLIDKVTTADGATIEGTDAGYAQAGFTVNITTGGTTPNVTGTTSAESGVTQSPAAYPTANPVQEIKPSVSVPIGVAMPGGIADVQGTATGEGTSTSSKTSENDMRWAKVEAALDKLDTLLPFLEGFFNVPQVPTTQPVSADGTSG